jgi:UDP-glucose 4-epimerase
MKIILTGGAGFLGSHTAVELVNEGYEPIIIDDFRNSNAFVIENIEKIIGKKITFYNADIGDQKKIRTIFKDENPVGLIHFAADKAVSESVINPLKYYNNNLGNLIKLLEVIGKFNLNSFIFSSSCTVYGEPSLIPVTEKTPIQPAFSPYGYTKQVGEKILTDFFKTKKHTVLTMLRYFNPIGAHPSSLIGELPIGIPSNLVPYLTQTAIGKRKQLTIFGNDYQTNDGTCIRDYIHVVDLARAHVLSLKNKLTSNNIYNVGVGSGSTVLEVVNCFEEVNNLKVNYQFGKRREGDVPEIYADNSLIKEELKWVPKFSLKDALMHAWNWERELNSRDKAD